jgi:hypothetical protein
MRRHLQKFRTTLWIRYESLIARQANQRQAKNEPATKDFAPGSTEKAKRPPQRAGAWSVMRRGL